MDDQFQELKYAHKELLFELRELSKNLRDHMDLEQEERQEIKLSLTRLESKVAIHDKGLGALGAMVMAALGALTSQFIARWFK